MMDKFGIVSYNIYCNFTNYGSALQSWALYKVINDLGKGRYRAVLIDYCPKSLSDKSPLDPIRNIQDKDNESITMCLKSMPAIRENYKKFNNFYSQYFIKTHYCDDITFDEIATNEYINGFVCGSDTIFCVDEFGCFVEGYFANFNCMKNGFSIAYGASFGDTVIEESSYESLKNRLNNFKFLGIRENRLIPLVKRLVSVPCSRTIDPTLLLRREDYDRITSGRLVQRRYVLLYARRFDKKMFDYADYVAKTLSCEVVNVSLRMSYLGKHIMYYQAGVEEFLSLVKHSEYVITNSFHGLIFAVQYGKPFKVFSRKSADSKIGELLELFGLSTTDWESDDLTFPSIRDYEQIYTNIAQYRIESLEFLKNSLNSYYQ